MTQPELFTPQTYRDRVADYLKSRQGQWVSAYELMDVGGRMAWRTRVSDARRQLGLRIENKIVYESSGQKTSYYRYTEAA